MPRNELNIESFLRGDFDPSGFTHREHVRMAFEMLRQHSFVQTALHYSEALQAMTQKLGRPEVFHQTVTIAFLSLIAERLESGRYDEFESFAAANQDLLHESALSRWYGPEQLARSSARRTFILPDPTR